jgi:hypothetical protein
MTFAKVLLLSLLLSGLPAGAALPAAAPPAPAVGKPETATAASVSAATGAAVSELIVQAPPKPPAVSELEVLAPPKAKTVSELDVNGHIKCVPPRFDSHATRPRVVSTYPKAGAVVRPGLLILRVTFDQPMSCAGYFAAVGVPQNPCDESGAEQRALMTFDRRTIRTPCLILPNTEYHLRMNAPQPEGQIGLPTPAFVSMYGGRMPSYHLDFSTSAAPMVQTVREAMTQDPETKLASPGA